MAGVQARLGERGVGAVRVVAPSDARRLVLAAVDDEWEAERLVAALRAEGEPAVTRPDGGARLEAWMRHTRPITFGERLSVCFAWSEHDRGDLPGLIELGAGGFGSGEHPSTQLVVEQLLERIKGGERVLDVGCGSGVLGLCALRARRVACGGGRHQGRCRRGDPTQRRAQRHGRGGWRRRVAPLGGDRGCLRRRRRRTSAGRRSSNSHPSSSAPCRPGGWLAVSGISPSQCSLVAGFLRPLVELERRTSGEWAALVLAHRDVRAAAD